MAHDYEDIHDLDDLSDDELRELARDHLRDHAGLDVDDISITARDGRVTLSGRVGTEGELRIAERVLTDTLGIAEVDNQLVVDSLRRAESPAAIDDHLVDEAEHAGLLLGEMPTSMDSESTQLSEDLDAQLFGTVDMQTVMEDGATYTPPTSPTPEGMDGTESGPGVMGEDH
jgi:BON domain